MFSCLSADQCVWLWCLAVKGSGIWEWGSLCLSSALWHVCAGWWQMRAISLLIRWQVHTASHRQTSCLQIYHLTKPPSLPHCYSDCQMVILWDFHIYCDTERLYTYIWCLHGTPIPIRRRKPGFLFVMYAL